MRAIPSSAWLVFGLLFLFLTLFASPAGAAAFRHAENLILPETETIHDDLYAFGKTADVQGTVDGDLVIAGQTVTISGTVTGDVIAAVRDLAVSGHVGGTIRAAGSSVTVSGTVGHDVVVGGGNLIIGPNARVGRDVLAGAGAGSFSGRIDRDVRLGGGSATFAGSVGGTVYARAKDVSLTDGAVLEHDLFYTSRNELKKQDGARVAGRIERTVPPEHEGKKFGNAALWWVRGLIGFLIFGAILHLLFTSAGARATETVRRAPLPSLGLGILLSFGVPCAAAALLIVGVMVGGWWIGLGALVLYLLVLAAGYVTAANYVGILVLQRGGRAPAYGWSLLTGLVLVGLVAAIPFLGWLLGWTVALLGVGALALAWYTSRPKGIPPATT
jgi:cytoskeletal protein CcmA (bactofilin family)